MDNKNNTEFRKIAIRVGDNDFHSTFRAVLAVLYDAYKYTGLPNNKEKLCWMINNLSPIIYVTHQNQWEYNGLQYGLVSDTNNNKEFTHTKEYLQITPDRVLINEEVDKLIEEGDKVHGFNCDTYVLDTTIYTNNIYSL